MPEVPACFRGAVRAVCQLVLQTICASHGANAHREEQAWKLFLLLLRMLLRLTTSLPHRAHRDELRERIARFCNGDWASLLQDGARLTRKKATMKNMGDVAESLICKGQLFTAAKTLTSPVLSPADEAKAAFPDPEKHWTGNASRKTPAVSRRLRHQAGQDCEENT